MGTGTNNLSQIVGKKIQNIEERCKNGFSHIIDIFLENRTLPFLQFFVLHEIRNMRNLDAFSKNFQFSIF